MNLARPEASANRRRRGSELEAALLDAAWDELNEHGYAALTFDGVARRARTSRPVVNRRWATKDALARDAIARASSRFVLTDPATGSVRDDVIDLLRQLNAAFVGFAAAMTAQLAAFFEETGTTPADLRKSLLGDRWTLIESVIRRGAERGEIDSTLLTPRILSLPFDLLRHDVLMNLAPLSDADIREIVDTVFLPLVAATRQPEPGDRTGDLGRTADSGEPSPLT
jgi:AcrR family transcriptional regulator